MKLFLIIPTLKQGGAERVMSELSNQWAREGHDVHIILLAKGNQFYELHGSIIVHKLGFENLGNIRKIFSEIHVFYRLRNLLKDERPDFVLSFMDKFNVFTILASRFLHLKIFISDRSNPKKEIKKSLCLLKTLTYRYATGIIAQTSLAKKIIHVSFKNNNIKTIPNPIKDVSLFPNIQREDIIINVGRMVPEKGQKYLLDAFSKIKDPKWKLVILGDGPLRLSLHEQIKKLELQDKVVMPGIVDNIDEWLARASIFAFPSISEGFPNALVEAMSAGLPCVSFDCDAGPRDLIKDGENGFLIKTKDTTSLTLTLSKLCIDATLRKEIGERAKEISKQLNTEIIAREYLDFFKQSSN